MRSPRELIGRGPAIAPLPPAHAEAPARPCVVHLVRAANGPAPFASFLEAVRRCPPGVESDLVLAFKGFRDPAEAEPYLEMASDLSPEALHFSDEGLDLTVYFEAARRLRRHRYCFLNSFSEPLAEGWLGRLDAALALPGVGIVGASGSRGSTRSWMAYVLRLPSAYRGILPPQPVAIQQFMALETARSGVEAPPDTLPRRMRGRMQAILDAPGQTLPFTRFPADHLRTNAFMITHRELAATRLLRVRTKWDAHVMENGRNSITLQLARRGLRTPVVDREGEVYDRDRWHRSRTFCQGGQEGLLVADNQTRLYAEGDADRRRLMSAFAWGPDAEPVAP